MKSRILAIRICIAGLTAMVLAGGGAGLAARAPQARPAAAPPQNEVSVILKLVQVFVTDKSGKPVTGLALSDFELIDNGTPQTLTDFEKHAPAEDPRARTAATAGPPLLNRKFFFVFDLSQNNPRGQRAALRLALTFLETQALPSDEFAVLAFTYAGGLGFREFLTTDRTGVARQIKALEEPVGAGMDADHKSDAMEGEDLGAGYEALIVPINPTKDRFMAKTADFAAALEGLARALRSLPGFKNIILFSSGLGENIIHDANDTRVMQNLKDMMREISSSACPIFTVDTDVVKDQPTSARGAGLLMQIARESGGHYFPSPERSAVVAESVNAITSHYYVLGYRIGMSWDGRYHALKVRVRRPGCEVRAQPGYYDPARYADLSPLEKGFHLLDLMRGKASPFLLPLDIPLAVLPYSGAEGSGRWNCVVLAELAPPELRELAGPKAELFFFIYDEKQATVWSKRSEVVWAELGTADAFPYSPVSLPPGAYSARAALRSVESGMTAVGSTDFTIPAPPGSGGDQAGLRLDPPLIVRPGRAASFLKAAEEKERFDLPSLVAVYPFVSVKAAPAVGWLEAAASPLEAVVRVIPFAAGRSLPDLAWSARFVRAGSGAEVPARATEVMAQPAGGAFVFLLEIERPDLAPGEYALEIRAADGASGRQAVTEARVSVR